MLYFIILVLQIFSSEQLHDLHLSIGNIYFNEKERRIEMEQRIFSDDLENALKMMSGDQMLDIFNEDISHDSLGLLMHQYVQNKLSITVGKKKREIEFLEFEFDQDAVVLYLYIPDIRKIQSLEIFSSILFELFNDQSNILSVKVNNKKRSARFDVGSKPKRFNFS